MQRDEHQDYEPPYVPLVFHLGWVNWYTFCGLKPGPGVLSYDVCSYYPESTLGTWCQECVADLESMETETRR